MSLGDDHQSDDYFHNKKVEKWLSLLVHDFREKKRDGHHTVMEVIITFWVMLPPLPIINISDSQEADM